MRTILFFAIAIFIFKISLAQPGYQWAGQFGSASQEVGQAITTDLLGNSYTTGTFYGTTDFDPGATVYNISSVLGLDAYITKLSPTGKFLWAKDLRSNNAALPWSIFCDNSNNIYVTGDFVDSLNFDPGLSNFTLYAGFQSSFIVKFDASGNFIWAKHLSRNTGSSLCSAADIVVDQFGDVIISGYFENTIDFDPGPGTYTLTALGGMNIGDVYILKLNSAGNFIWVKSIGSGGVDKSVSLDLDVSGNIISTGLFAGTVDFDPSAASFNMTSPGANDMFVWKIDPLGNFLWAKQLGGASGSMQPKAISLAPAGEIMAIGNFSGVIDFDPGISTYTLTASAIDAFILKLDAAGNFNWPYGIGGSNADDANGLAVDASSNVYVAGFFENTVDFDPGAGTYTLSTASTMSAFNMKLDASGNFVWAGEITGTGASLAYGLCVDAPGNVYTTGYFKFTNDFDPSASVANLSSFGQEDAFVQKLSQGNSSIKEAFKPDVSLIYPNPNNGAFNFKNLDINKGSMEIYNALGQKVYSSNLNGEYVNTNLPKGIYFYVLNNSKEIYEGKFVVE